MAAGDLRIGICTMLGCRNLYCWISKSGYPPRFCDECRAQYGKNIAREAWKRRNPEHQAEIVKSANRRHSRRRKGQRKPGHFRQPYLCGCDDNDYLSRPLETAHSCPHPVYIDGLTGRRIRAV